MSRFCNNTGLVPNLTLAVFLIAAQTAVAAHDIKHDPGTTQNQVCTTCVAASQLGSASIDTHTDFAIGKFESFCDPVEVIGYRSTYALVVRQRGPPTPF